jgi:hypothetical protein
MTLNDALIVCAPALEPTPRFSDVTVLLKGGELSAYNGNLACWAPIPNHYGPVALSAPRLKTVWSPSATMSVANAFTTITRGKTRYRLAQKPTAEIIMPPQIEGGTIFPENLRRAVKYAMTFMSSNAIHLWANAVTITFRGVITTNNQILAKVPIESPFSVQLPPWALTVLFSRDELPLFAYTENTIKFEYSDGAIIQAQKLDVEMPDKFFDLADSLTPALIPIGNILADLQEVNNIGGRFCQFSSDGTITVDGENGEQAQTMTEIQGQFKMSLGTAELVFGVATHIGFDNPTKLKFYDAKTGLIGIAVGAT